jgi:hypothetical protein
MSGEFAIRRICVIFAQRLPELGGGGLVERLANFMQHVGGRGQRDLVDFASPDRLIELCRDLLGKMCLGLVMRVGFWRFQLTGAGRGIFVRVAVAGVVEVLHCFHLAAVKGENAGFAAVRDHVPCRAVAHRSTFWVELASTRRSPGRSSGAAYITRQRFGAFEPKGQLNQASGSRLRQAAGKTPLRSSFHSRVQDPARPRWLHARGGVSVACCAMERSKQLPVSAFNHTAEAIARTKTAIERSKAALIDAAALLARLEKEKPLTPSAPLPRLPGDPSRYCP